VEIPYELDQIVYWHGGHGPILEIHITRGKQFVLVEDVSLTNATTSEKRAYKKFGELYLTLSEQQYEYHRYEIE
jgi:hypothetical protein